jgi:hypothetical protein
MRFPIFVFSLQIPIARWKLDIRHHTIAKDVALQKLGIELLQKLPCALVYVAQDVVQEQAGVL